MQTDDALIAKIERVLAKFPAVALTWHHGKHLGSFTDEVAYSALGTEVTALAEYVYGSNQMARRIRDNVTARSLTHLEAAEGMLRGTIEAIRNGLLNDLRTEVLLDVQADFIDAARESVAGGGKDVAAVLACVVLEDSLKRLAVKVGKPELQNQEFSVVVVSLFTAGELTKATKGLLLSYRDLRNAALHAQWHEVSAEAVNGLLYFLPGFIEQHGI